MEGEKTLAGAKSVEDEDSKELRVQAAEIRNGKKPKASCRSCLQR